MLPFTRPPADLWHEVAVLVHRSPLGEVSPLVWEAVAANVALIASQNPANSFGGACSLLQPDTEFAHPHPIISSAA